jgi:nitrogenase iron protein NifH
VELLKNLRVFEELDLDVVVYDVLGDVVCGGFAVPIREGIAEHVFTVSSSDFMAIYAANNLFKGIQKYSNNGGALLGGVIANSINTAYSKEIVDDFVAQTKTQVIEYVPRSVTVTQSELQGKTTIQAFPDSEQGKVYKRLANKIYEHTNSTVPAPLNDKELHDWAFKWADTLLAMETGEVRSQAASI